MLNEKKSETYPGNQGHIYIYIHILLYIMLNEEQNMPWKPGKHKLMAYIYICHETFIKQIRNKNMPWKPGETNIYMPWKPGKYTHALETREIYTCPGNQGNIYMPWKPGKAGKSYKT